MYEGDLVSLRRNPDELFGVAFRIFEIENRQLHKEPLPMVEVLTTEGVTCIWKKRKLQAFVNIKNIT